MIKINANAFPLTALKDEYGRLTPQLASVEARNQFLAAAPNEWKDEQERDLVWRLLTLCANLNVSRNMINGMSDMSFREQLDLFHNKLLKLHMTDRIDMIRNRFCTIPDVHTPEFVMFVEWLAGAMSDASIKRLSWTSLIRDACKGATHEWKKAFFDGAYCVKQES